MNYLLNFVIILLFISSQSSAQPILVKSHEAEVARLIRNKDFDRATALVMNIVFQNPTAENETAAKAMFRRINERVAKNLFEDAGKYVRLGNTAEGIKLMKLLADEYSNTRYGRMAQMIVRRYEASKKKRQKYAELSK